MKKNFMNLKEKKADKSDIERERSPKVMTELFSIKVKLTLSHVAIVLIPVILLVLILYMSARNEIMTEVTKTNLALVNQGTNLINSKLDEINEDSVLLLIDDKTLRVISKKEEDYDSSFEQMEDRQENLFRYTTALVHASDELRTIAFINKDEVINYDRRDYLFEDAFLNDFFKSNEYETVKSAKFNPVWFYGLYGTNQLNCRNDKDFINCEV